MKRSKFSIKACLAILMSIFALTLYCGGEEGGDNSSSAPSDPMKNKGIGPVKSVSIGDSIDPKMAKDGEVVYEAKCSACHKMNERVVGPALKDVTKRRTPEWIMNMILNPQEMTKNDPIGQELFAEYLTQMTFQNITEEEARSLVEYFRKVDSE